MATGASRAELFDEIKMLFRQIVAEDRGFIVLALLYGAAISLLTLAVPVSVQFLVNSVAHIASLQAVIILSTILFLLLVFSGLFHAIQTYVMELFERRIFARLSAEFTLRFIHADYQQVERLNRNELVNRFFDIMSIQRIVPNLIIGMFALILQMVVGVVLVSFYHPWFLAFNLCFVLLVWLIWRVWGNGAMRKAIDMSAAKYRTARHLEDVARAVNYFKSNTRQSYAIDKTERLVSDYMRHRVEFFRFSFAQHIAFLSLYALASSLLLGLGGWLVIKGELTLGQLVAAELVLSAVFYGISRLGYGLVQCYELGAGLEEINQLYELPVEKPSGARLLSDHPVEVQFHHAHFRPSDEREASLHVMIEAGEHALVYSNSNQLQHLFLQAVKGYLAPVKGRVSLSGLDVNELDRQQLRDRIIAIDRAGVIECTVIEYLRMNCPDVTMSAIYDVLRDVELQQTIDELELGFDTPLGFSGLPLSATETMRLKLASALLAKPRLLVLTEYFDTLSYARRQRIMQRLCAQKNFTLMYFTNRLDLNGFDSYRYFDHGVQTKLESIDALRHYQKERAQ